ncbi:MAG: hypothetical protein JKY37_03600 [Nannocystaceae bacterium]|nr:hypothetical protein [Nannocystaceae bacterium]
MGVERRLHRVAFGGEFGARRCVALRHSVDRLVQQIDRNHEVGLVVIEGVRTDVCFMERYAHAVTPSARLRVLYD